MSNTPRILILDSTETGHRLSALLAPQGWHVQVPRTLKECSELMEAWDVDVVLLNAGPEETDAFGHLKAFIRQSPDTRVIIVADYESADRAVEALRRGAHGYVLKPLARDALLKSIENAVAQKRAVVGERRRAEAEIGEFKEALERLVQEKTFPLREANARLQAYLDVLKMEESRFRSIFETAQAALFVKDGDMRYTLVNPAAEKLFGIAAAEWIGQTDEALFGREAAGATREDDARALGGEIIEEEHRFLVRGIPTTMHFKRLPLRNGSGSVVGVWGTACDVTEKKHLERQLQAAQRIESLGTLAGGVAHNFNNLLTGILGTVSLLLMELDPSDPAYRKLKRMEDYVRKGVTLTRQLLGFARGGKYEVKILDINKVVEKAIVGFPQTEKEVLVHLEKDPRLWPVKGDEGQLEQVLMNLYVNAWEAMPEGGDLFVKTENRLLDVTMVRPYRVTPGRYVQLTVRDTGTGMDMETQQRVFEPFFTTKEVGAATGLGLAAAYGIIKNHGGFISVQSEKGRGTAVEILLPAIPSEQREEGSGPEGGRQALSGSP